MVKSGEQAKQIQFKNTQQRIRNEVIVDATDCVAGRMCSRVAKLLLKGNRVSVVNSENAMLSGDRYMTINLYKEYLEISSVTNPIHGPFHPRRPDTILTRMVRGMIPKTKTSGIEAFKRLRVYIGIPEELRNKKAEFIQDAKITRAPSKYISVGDVAKEIGWHGVLREETKQQAKQVQSLPTKTSQNNKIKDQKPKVKQTEKTRAKSQETLSKK
ncbi:MAG: 50S ribosomal protein L13 [Nitrososphaeraceae archaeon]